MCDPPRLVRDLEPLLADPQSSGERATLELVGHSMGGAVALIVALKLIQRGHRVTGVRLWAGQRRVGYAVTHAGRVRS